MKNVLFRALILLLVSTRLTSHAQKTDAVKEANAATKVKSVI